MLTLLHQLHGMKVEEAQEDILSELLQDTRKLGGRKDWSQLMNAAGRLLEQISQRQQQQQREIEGANLKIKLVRPSCGC